MMNLTYKSDSERNKERCRDFARGWEWGPGKCFIRCCGSCPLSFSIASSPSPLFTSPYCSITLTNLAWTLQSSLHARLSIVSSYLWRAVLWTSLSAQACFWLRYWCPSRACKVLSCPALIYLVAMQVWWWRHSLLCFNGHRVKEHYTCMVDLLGNAGYLQEAEKMIRPMPWKPHVAPWKALLNT